MEQVFMIRFEAVDKATSLLSELSTSWGGSSVETRELATLRSKCESEARALEEIANALSIEDKDAEELASSILFLRKVAPSLRPIALETALEEEVKNLKANLNKYIKQENSSSAFSTSLILEKCGCGEEAEIAFEEIRVWKVSSVPEWCALCRKERLYATKCFPNSTLANNAFEKTAIRSIKEFMHLYYSLENDDARKRASKVKSLADALSDLKEACGPAQAAKQFWDTKWNEIRDQTTADAEKIILEYTPLRWSNNFHSVDTCCLEIFGLLSRAGIASEPTPSIINGLLDRLRESMRGGENDLFVLLGCCNSVDYIASYLDEFTTERNRALSMLKTSKEGFVKRACAELEKNGEQFVKQSARYFQVQNPVLRTELRLEVSKAWKSSSFNKKHASDRDNSSNLDDSFSGKDATVEVGGVVALFFEGPSLLHN